jgi:hypothetical protein
VSGRRRWGRRLGHADRPYDDAGGVWIVTGIVCGIILYGFIVLMDVAGFTAILPLVVVPPVLVGMIGANSLLGGGRRPGRPAGPPMADGPSPSATSGRNGAVPGGSRPAAGGPAAEGPPGPG